MPKPPLRRLEELFHQAVALDPPRRPAFLETACAGDAELRAAVEELLKHDRGGSSDEFLQSPVASQAERLRPLPLLSTLVDVVQNRPGPTPQHLPTIAGYELLEEIGRGGMGVVYKARQISLNRIVALKMLLAGGLFSTEQFVRFRTEAEALAKLHHTNIVTIFEIAESEGRPYFTMEYIAGPSLAEIINGHPQDVTEAARLLEIVARAVHAVHQCGIIHRDLKPANILLQKSEIPSPKSEIRDPKSEIAYSDFGFRISDLVPKITDFGLAKDQSEGQKLTKTGAAMGTPSYMAPEQARGSARIGTATDIYALGSILYEMLTGRPPFDAGGPAETIAQLLNDEPLPPSRLRPKLPRDVVTICLKCLEKTPRKRYGSALELAEDLRRFLAGEPIHARPVGFAERTYRWCRRRPLVAGLLALSTVLALTCIATVITYEVRWNQALQKEVQDEKQQIVQLHVQIGVAAAEADDTFAAILHFTHALKLDEGSDREHQHRTRIATALRHCPRLVEVVTLEREVLCADHERVVTIDANFAIEVRSLHAAQTVASGVRLTDKPHDGTLSPDGRFLAVLHGKGAARIWDLSRSESHDLPPSNGDEVERLVFHPDGRILLVQRVKGALEAWDVTTWTQLPWDELAKGTAPSALTDNGRWGCTCNADHNEQVWDMGTGKPRGAALKFGHPFYAASVAPDGTTLAVVGPDSELSVWDVLASRQLGKSVRLPGTVSRIVFSPDAQHIATICSDGMLRVYQVPTGAMLFQTSPVDGAATLVKFSADGRFLLTMSKVGETRVWDAATGHAVTPPLRHGGRHAFATFRADGKEIVTVSKTGLVCAWELPRGPDVRRIPSGESVSASGTESRSLNLANGITVQISGTADGKLKPADPGKEAVGQAVLSPNKDRVAVCDDAATVIIRDAITGEPSIPPLRHRSPVRYAAFSSDGSRLLTACDDRTVRLWDANTGELLAPPMRHALAIRRVNFQDADTRAHIFHESEMVSVWDVAEDERSIEELQKLARTMAGGHSEPGQR
jgi:serine/threonine protein kinase/WD40 repeat protein